MKTIQINTTALIVASLTLACSTQAGEFGKAVDAAIDRVGATAVHALSESASGVLRKHRNEGGNGFGGNVEVRTKVRVGGSVEAENYSEGVVGSARFVNSQVGGNTKVNASVEVGGEVKAKNASTVIAGSVDAKNARVVGSVTADAKLRVGGSIVAENGSYVNAASLRMNGSRVGGNVTFKSDVSIGRDIRVKNLSAVIIGGLEP